MLTVLTDSRQEIDRTISKRMFKRWCLRTVIGYVVVMTGICIYLFGFSGWTPNPNRRIQKNYALYLTEQNDAFIDSMIEFTSMTKQTGQVYSPEQKAEIQRKLNEQNDFLKEMQLYSPSEQNQDYLDLYQDMLRMYAFYIQGETMVAEYCYNYSDNTSPEGEKAQAGSYESYTTGSELCNMFGNMILNNFTYINDVRHTDYQSKFDIRPLQA